MFELEYKGANTLVMTTKKSTLVVDPKLSLVGLKDIKTKGQIQLATESRFTVASDDTQVVIDGPGEYEVGEFTIRGVAATRHIDTTDQEKLSTIYRIETGEIRVAIVGNVDSKLSEDQLEAIGVVDILVLPVGGGGYTLDATSAASVVRSIEPKVVVPVHYAASGLSYEVPQDSLETFVSELGAPKEATPKLKLKSASALPPVLTIVEVERS